MGEENEKIAYDPMAKFCSHTGERIAGLMRLRELMSKNPPEGVQPERVYRRSRPKFHHMTLDPLDRIGVQVEYGKEVVNYFEDAESGRAGVVLKDGSRHEADLVVTADGLHGQSWALVAGHLASMSQAASNEFQTLHESTICCDSSACLVCRLSAS